MSLVQRAAGAHDHALHADRRLVGVEQPADERRPAQQRRPSAEQPGAQPDLEPACAAPGGTIRGRPRPYRSRSVTRRAARCGRAVAVLFDFGNTLFAHAPLAATIVAAAGRLGAPITPRTPRSWPRRIDAARRCADEARPSARPRRRGVGGALAAALRASPTTCGPASARRSTRRCTTRRSGCRSATRPRRSPRCTTPASPSGSSPTPDGTSAAPFAEHGLDDARRRFTLSCEVGVAKPDRAIFAIACAPSRVSSRPRC